MEFSIYERRLLRKNRDHLMDNKPQPLLEYNIPSSGMSNRQLDRQHTKLVNFSTAMSTSTIGRTIAESIISDVKDQHTNQPTTAGMKECDKCGFIPTAAILQTLPYFAQDGECVQCREASAQGKKAVAKNNLLDLIYKQQLKSNVGFVDNQYCTKVCISDFLMSKQGDEVSASIIPILPKMEVSVKVVNAREYSYSQNYNQISEELAGATWATPPELQHPNTTMSDDTMVLLLYSFRSGRISL